MSNSEVVIACDLSALTADQRTALETLSPEIFGAVENVSELADGYAFRLPSTFSLAKLADFITYDHLCCPFFNHGLEVEPYDGSIWLRMTGSFAGTKALIIAEIGDNNLLREGVAIAAGFKR